MTYCKQCLCCMSNLVQLTLLTFLTIVPLDSMLASLYNNNSNNNNTDFYSCLPFLPMFLKSEVFLVIQAFYVTDQKFNKTLEVSACNQLQDSETFGQKRKPSGPQQQVKGWIPGLWPSQHVKYNVRLNIAYCNKCWKVAGQQNKQLRAMLRMLYAVCHKVGHTVLASNVSLLVNISGRTRRHKCLSDTSSPVGWFIPYSLFVYHISSVVELLLLPSMAHHK